MVSATTATALLFLLTILTLFECTSSVSQRFRVTIQKNDEAAGLGLRLVKLSAKIIILEIAPNSPAARAGGGLLKVGDAIIAVDNDVVPPKSTVRDVERLILKCTGLSIDLIVLKGWQEEETATKATADKAKAQKPRTPTPPPYRDGVY